MYTRQTVSKQACLRMRKCAQPDVELCRLMYMQTPQLLHSWGMLMGRLAVTVNHLWPTPGSAGRPQATITADEASTEYQAAVPGGNHPMHCDGVVPQGLMRDHAWRMEGAAATLRILLPQAQILSKEQRLVCSWRPSGP